MTQRERGASIFCSGTGKTDNGGEPAPIRTRTPGGVSDSVPSQPSAAGTNLVAVAATSSVPTGCGLESPSTLSPVNPGVAVVRRKECGLFVSGLDAHSSNAYERVVPSSKILDPRCHKLYMHYHYGSRLVISTLGVPVVSSPPAHLLWVWTDDGDGSRTSYGGSLAVFSLKRRLRLLNLGKRSVVDRLVESVDSFSAIDLSPDLLYQGTGHNRKVHEALYEVLKDRYDGTFVDGSNPRYTEDVANWDGAQEVVLWGDLGRILRVYSHG